ncbi:GumC family protein [Hirschia litorea]|uniref:non-specific protein-tyrosine kinase n=1 Tax=Hirschia litorea TaxID=1199156 RepID=A0ABW2IPP5_9PROT
MNQHHPSQFNDKFGHLMHASNAQPNAPEENEELISVADIFALIARRLKVILSVFIVVSAIGIAITMTQIPKYTATSLLMISPNQDNVVSDTQSLSGNIAPNDTFVNSEIEVLKSPALTRRMVEELNLIDEPEWNPLLRTPSAIRQMISSVLPTSKETNSPVNSDDLLNSIVSAVQNATSISLKGKTYVIEVAVTSESPEMAAKISNALANLYLGTKMETQFASADNANVWLSDRLEQLKQELQIKEAAVQVFRADKGLLTAEGVSLVETQIADVQSAVVSSRAEYAEKMARYEQVVELINSGGSADSIAGVLNSTVIRDLRVKETDIIQRQAELENQFGPLYPAVEKVKKEREDLNAQIRAEISRIASNLKNEADVVRTRLNTLESNLQSVRKNLISNNKELVRLNELETDAKAARVVYESFLTRFHEVSQQGELSSIDAKIVSAAQRPRTPSSPNIKLGSALSLFMGLGLGLGLAFFLEQFRNVLSSPEDVERLIGYPAIVSIPVVQKKDFKSLRGVNRNPAGYVLTKQMSAYAEALRVLRTSVKYSASSSPNKVVAMTSALPGEGKTTTSLALARIAASSEQKTIIVDCDIRRQSMNELMGLTPSNGLLEVLSNQAEWKSVVVKDPQSDVDVIPVASYTHFTPRDLFGTQAMEELVQSLSQEYDLVILDCAPVLAVAETRVIVTYADAVIIVAQWGKTNPKAVASAIHQLSSTTSNILGIALNKVDPKAPGKSSYYDSLYYKGSKKYYHS